MDIWHNPLKDTPKSAEHKQNLSKSVTDWWTVERKDAKSIDLINFYKTEKGKNNIEKLKSQKRITPEKEIELKEKYLSGISLTELANHYNVSVRRIKIYLRKLLPNTRLVQVYKL